MRSAEDVYTFWFADHDEKDWYGGAPEFDALLDQQFRTTHQAVAQCEASAWRETPRGRLAEIIVLDQFSRQLHRGSREAFASDTMALALAQEAIARGLDMVLPERERGFLYMPFMHSESLHIHDLALPLFEALNENMLEFERKHRALIERFGRFPKRNAALGRPSTEAEIAYIAQSGSSMF